MGKESVGRILPFFLFLILLSLFLILAENFGKTSPVRSLVEKLIVPAQSGVYRSWQGVAGGFSFLTYWRQGQTRITKLEEEIRKLAVERARLAILEEENKALRRQLEVPLPPTLKFLPAKTLALTRYLTVDKGEEDGVREGMMVVSENILVGKVVKVSPKTAQVLLPVDPDSKIPARVIKTNARGLVVGEFGTKLSLAKVLQEDVLEVDDLVVTTGEGDYLPDLLIGKIGKIEKIETEPFQKAEITPLLDYGKLVNVFVIK